VLIGIMEQLLEIRTIPISIEYKINRGHFEIGRTNASVEISQNEGMIQMRMKPISLNLDSVEIRNSAVIKNPTSAIYNFVELSSKPTYEATAIYGEEGNMMLNIHITNNPTSEIALRKFNSDVSFNFGFIPTYETGTSSDFQELMINYEMDKLNFDWKIKRPEIKFIPGDIEFIIKEYPRVEINYVGKPIYVPASADPDYKPIDTFA